MGWLTTDWNSVVRVRISTLQQKMLKYWVLVSPRLRISEALLGQRTDNLIVGWLLVSISSFFGSESLPS